MVIAFAADVRAPGLGGVETVCLRTAGGATLWTLLSLLCGDVFGDVKPQPPGSDARPWVIWGLLQPALEILRGTAMGGLGQLAESRGICSLGDDDAGEGLEVFRLPGIGTGTDLSSWCLLSGLFGDRLDGEWAGLPKEAALACGDDDGDEDGVPMVKVALLGEVSVGGIPGEVWRFLEDEGGDCASYTGKSGSDVLRLG